MDTLPAQSYTEYEVKLKETFIDLNVSSLRIPRALWKDSTADVRSFVRA